jgi:hypothetical protein
MDPLDEYAKSIQPQINNKYIATKYDECYVAFLDILGMQKLVEKKYDDLRKVFNCIEVSIQVYKDMIIAETGEKVISKNQIIVTIMSDSIVLSIKKEIENSFSKIIGVSFFIIKRLLKVLDNPVFIRGGIACGKISHTDFSVFGPGLVKAYTLENEIAINMRCIVSPELYETRDFLNYIKENGLVKDCSDNLFFIDFMESDNNRLKDFALQEILSEKLSPKVKNKYRWLLNLIAEK